MLIASALMLVGLLAGVAATQLSRLRLGGVIVIPVVAVYLLRNFVTFPVFVLSTLAAYVSLQYIKRRAPLYGRSLFVIAILVGALVPLTTFELLALGFGVENAMSGIEFIGSVLPGIAAYNFSRLEVEDRVLDGVMSLAMLLLLVVFGIGLCIVVALSPYADVLPPILLGPESDVALALGLTVERAALPVISSNALAVALIAVGMGAGELVRSRYGLRVAGIIAVPLVVLIALRNVWMLPMWLLASALAFVGIQALHRWTLLYGRVVLASGVIVGLLTATVVATVVPVGHGLLPFFVGVLGGVAAYNVHVVAPAERPATVAVTLALFVLVAFLARLFVIPPSGGFLVSVGPVDLVVGAVLVGPALVALSRLERIRPGRGSVSEVGRYDPAGNSGAE